MADELQTLQAVFARFKAELRDSWVLQTNARMTDLWHVTQLERAINAVVASASVAATSHQSSDVCDGLSALRKDAEADALTSAEQLRALVEAGVEQAGIWRNTQSTDRANKAAKAMADALEDFSNALQSRSIGREEIARVIQPKAWETDDSGLLRYRDARAVQKAALETADQILALLPPVSQWRPISEAPMDGTVFIALQDGDIYKCDWREEDDYEGGHREGWWDHINISFEEPTHYMPLPDPPTPVEGEG